MRFSLAAALLLICSPAAAQIKSKAAVQSEINSNLPNNTTGLITPSVMRSLMTDVVNSYLQGSTVNAQTSTTYTVQCSDMGSLLTFNNSSAIAVTLPSAATACFNNNWLASLKNNGTGTVTITPVAGTINGAANTALASGQSLAVISDGTNWQTWGAGSATLAPNTVTNADLTQAGAATIKGNPTAAGPANVQDFTIQGLTNAAPNATLDFIPYFNHTTGSIENATPSQISSAVGSGVTSFNSRTGAVIPGSADYTAPQIGYTPPGTGAVATTVQVELQRYGVWANDFGAVCNNATSDFTAFQNAINEAEALGLPMRFSNGGVGQACALATALSVTSGLEIAGTGPFGGAVLVITNTTQNGIVVNTTAPVYFHDFSMTYSSAPSSGVFEISVTAPSGFNTSSRFERLNLESGGQNCLGLFNANSWTVVNSQIACSALGIQISNPANPDAGDNTISGSIIQTIVAGGTAISWSSGGGLRIVNNKINSNQMAAAINLNLASGASTSDIIIADNSIEGFQNGGVGISISRQGATGVLNNIQISNNQFLGPSYCVFHPTDPNGTFTTGLTFTTNICQQGTTTAGSGVFVDSTIGLVVSDNVFIAGLSTDVATSLGASLSAANCVTGPNVKVGTYSGNALASCSAIAPN